MRARIRGTEIYFDVEGCGLVPDGNRMVERPTALVIHGGPGGDHTGFKPGFAPLAERMQLVYFDHRGQGRSAKGDPTTYTLDENVEDMEALRVHLGLGPIVSIGTSYGGMVAMAHAARYPASVSHLVLVVTAAHAGFNARAREIVAARGTDFMRAARAGVSKYSTRLASSSTCQRLNCAASPPVLRSEPERSNISTSESPAADSRGGLQHRDGC